MESTTTPGPEQEENKSSETPYPPNTQHCHLLSKPGKEICDQVSKNYCAVEFRVDMFLQKLCKEWVREEKVNDLIATYLGDEVPESFRQKPEMSMEHVEYFEDCISRAIGTLRMLLKIPIIYTVRTKEDGGYLPTQKKTDYALYNHLVRFGAKTCPGYVDLEFQYEENMAGIGEILHSFPNSLAIMSKHYIKRENLEDHQQLLHCLKMHSDSVDILKIVSSFTTLEDFTSSKKLTKSSGITCPSIQSNLGEKMKISRVLNKFMLPVSAPEIAKMTTAPGQMGREEVLEVREKLGMDLKEGRNFYLLGSPITFSPSPTFHNKVFEQLGMSDKYKKLDTDNIDCALYIIEKACTFGCSVTIPLKSQIFAHFEEFASEDAKYIGAVNTVVKYMDKESGTAQVKVYNTDWIAIYNLLAPKLAKVEKRTGKVLIIGTGGTTKAAIYAVLKLGLVPIIHGRKSNVHKNMLFMQHLWKFNETPQYCHDLSMFAKTSDFKPFKQLIELNDENGLDLLTEGIMKHDSTGEGVDAVISCIPGMAGFTIPEDVLDVILNESRSPVVYDASYLPKETELLKQARAQKCQVVTGVEMLVSQAWEQAKLFTGKQIFSDEMKEEVEKSVYEYYDSIDA